MRSQAAVTSSGPTIPVLNRVVRRILILKFVAVVLRNLGLFIFLWHLVWNIDAALIQEKKLSCNQVQALDCVRFLSAASTLDLTTSATRLHFGMIQQGELGVAFVSFSLFFIFNLFT